MEHYKTITKDGKQYIVFDTLQAQAEIFKHNRKLGACDIYGKRGEINEIACDN